MSSGGKSSRPEGNQAEQGGLNFVQIHWLKSEIINAKVKRSP